MFRFFGKIFGRSNNQQQNNDPPVVTENENPTEVSANDLPPIIGIYRASSVLQPQESKVQQDGSDDGPGETERPDARQSVAAMLNLNEAPKRKRKKPAIPEITPKKRRTCSPARARTFRLGNVVNTPKVHATPYQAFMAGRRNGFQERAVAKSYNWRPNYCPQLDDVNAVRPYRHTVWGSNYSQFGRMDGALNFNVGNWERVRRLRQRNKKKNSIYNLLQASLKTQKKTQLFASNKCSPDSPNFDNDICKASSKCCKNPEEVNEKPSCSLKNYFNNQRNGEPFSNPQLAQNRCMLPRGNIDCKTPKTETFPQPCDEEPDN